MPDLRVVDCGRVSALRSQTLWHALAYGVSAREIEDAVVVVGNLIERFDHVAASRVLALPDEVRAEVLRLMERFVAATPIDAAAFRESAVAAYGEALGLEPRFGALSAYERERLAELDARFRSPAWVRGPARPEPRCAQVKVRAGVYVVWTEHEGNRAVATVVGDRIERGPVADPELDGALTAALASARFVG